MKSVNVTVNENNATQIVKTGGWTQPQDLGPHLSWMVLPEPRQARAAFGQESAKSHGPTELSSTQD